MNKIIFYDGTEFEIKESSTATDIVADVTESTFFEYLEKFTDSNLKEFSFAQDGTVYATFENYAYSGVTLDTDMVAHFQTRQKTEMELLKEEIESLKTSQDIQDGAIGDLAEIIGG